MRVLFEENQKEVYVYLILRSQNHFMCEYLTNCFYMALRNLFLYFWYYTNQKIIIFFYILYMHVYSYKYSLARLVVIKLEL